MYRYAYHYNLIIAILLSSFEYYIFKNIIYLLLYLLIVYITILTIICKNCWILLFTYFDFIC